MSKFAMICFIAVFAAGCQKSATVETAKNDSAFPAPTEKNEKTVVSPPNLPSKINVPQLANRSPEETDKIFGAPAQANNVENGGKYRLYKLPNYPKGLAVRFYGGKAKSFNLILENPAATSKAAITDNFGIDLGNLAPVRDKSEPLSENFQGTFGGVNFAKISAKRQAAGGGFVFILAETAN